MMIINRLNKKMKLPEIDLSDKKKYEFDPNFKPYVISEGDAKPLPPGAKITTKKRGMITTEVIESTQEIAQDNENNNNNNNNIIENQENSGQVKTVKKLIESRPVDPSKREDTAFLTTNRNKLMQTNQTSAEDVSPYTNNSVRNNNNAPVSFNSRSNHDDGLAKNLLSNNDLAQPKSFNRLTTNNNVQNNTNIGISTKNAQQLQNNNIGYSYNNKQPIHLNSQTGHRRILTSNNLQSAQTNTYNNQSYQRLNSHVGSNEQSSHRKINHQKNKSYDPQAYINSNTNPLNEYAMQQQNDKRSQHQNNTDHQQVSYTSSNNLEGVRRVIGTPNSQTNLGTLTRSKSKNRIIKLTDYGLGSKTNLNVNTPNNANTTNSYTVPRGMTKNRSYNDLQTYQTRLNEMNAYSAQASNQTNTRINNVNN